MDNVDPLDIELLIKRYIIRCLPNIPVYMAYSNDPKMGGAFATLKIINSSRNGQGFETLFYNGEELFKKTSSDQTVDCGINICIADNCYQMALKLSVFHRLSGAEYLDENNMLVIGKPNIRKIPIVVDSKYQNRVNIDIKFLIRVNVCENISKIDEIDIELNQDNITKNIKITKE